MRSELTERDRALKGTRCRVSPTNQERRARSAKLMLSGTKKARLMLDAGVAAILIFQVSQSDGALSGPSLPF
jgi:hypothetical protein